MKHGLIMLLILLLTAWSSWGQNIPAPPAGNTGLDELKKQFEATIRDAQRQEREGAQLRQQRYLAGLTALDDALQAAGHQLSAVLAVRAEKARFEQSGDIPPTALSADLPAVRQLQNAWRAQAAGAPREQAQKIVAASERYLQSLALLQKNLAARNDTRGVADVNAEKERLLGINQVREALAVLQATPATLQNPMMENKPAANSAPKEEYKIKLRNGQELTFSRVLRIDSGDSLTVLTGMGAVLVPLFKLPEATLRAIQQVKRLEMKVRGTVEKPTSTGLWLSQAHYETLKTEPEYSSPFNRTVKRMAGNAEKQWKSLDYSGRILVLKGSRDPAKQSSDGTSWQGVLYPAGECEESFTDKWGYTYNKSYKRYALTPEEAVLWTQGHQD